MPDPAPARRGHGARGLRRAASQAGLIAALLAVFTVCAAAAGTSALLLTAGSDRAMSAAVDQADGTDADGGADVTTVFVIGASTAGSPRPDAATLAPVVRRALEEAAAPYRSRVSLWATTDVLSLVDRELQRGYLLDADTVTDHASLIAGTWPTGRGAGGSIPVAIPSTAAKALGAGVGTRLRLGPERGQDESAAYLLVVTGVFAADGSPAWGRDTLRGRGYDPGHLGLPTAGPFVVAPGTLADLRAPVGRVVAVLDPDLAADASGVPALLERVDGLAARLRDDLGKRVTTVRVLSDFGTVFGRMHTELAVTNALVVSVFVLVVVLGVATAGLMARVLVGRRGAEYTLLRDRGASGAQLAAGAAAEAIGVTALAAVAAAPLALAAYDLTMAITAGGAPSLTAAGPPAVAFASALAAGAGLPAAVLVVAMVPEGGPRRRRGVAGRVARSGVDLMLVVVAVIAYVQLRTHVASTGTVDPLLVGAPTVCAAALAALAVRLLPVAARVADRAAGRARALALPLAGWHLARGSASRGVFHAVLATAIGTFGVAFLATWSTSQADQAAAQIGTDLVVERAGGPGTAREIGSATGGTVTPVADRPVGLGSRPGGVRLVALDAAVAGKVLGSRPPADATWPQVMASLVPAGPGAPLAAGTGPRAITITGAPRPGAVAAGLPLPVVSATPTLVLADEAGSTATRVGSEVALDGRPHTTRLPLPGQPELPEGTWRVVAIQLLLADHTFEDLIAWGGNSATMQVSVSIEGAAAGGASWDGAGDGGPGSVRPIEVTARGDTVAGSFSWSVLGLSWQDAKLTLLSFPASTQLPVAVTEGLAAELGLVAGDRIGLAWGTAMLEAVVVRTVPYVPGHVREDALLADQESLQRALLSAGELESTTDAWWVGAPRAGAAEALRAAGGGPVRDRAQTTALLRDGPLRAPLQVAWWLAIATAAGLAVAGSAAHAAGEAGRRATTLARVRALGCTRREALASHLAQHVAVTAMGVGLGAACGAVLASQLAPLLVVSQAGQRAVPAATLVWPAAPLLAVLATILLGGLVAGVPSALSVVRRSTAAALRAGDAA